MFESIYIWRLSHYREAMQWILDVRFSHRLCAFPPPPPFIGTCVLTWVTQINPTADASVEIVALSSYIDGIDEPVIIASFLSFNNQAEAEAALRPIHDDLRRPQGTLVADFATPVSLPIQYAKQDASNPTGHRYCADNAYLRNDEPDIPGVLEEAFTALPSRKSFSLYFAMAPTSRRPHYAGTDLAAPGSMALSMQSDHYYAIYSVWEDAKDDDQCISQTRRIMKNMEKYSVGSYLGDSDMQTRNVKFWRDANAQRLMEIRKKWDPEGRICGFLDVGDKSGVNGLPNLNAWETS